MNFIVKHQRLLEIAVVIAIMHIVAYGLKGMN